MKNLFKTLFIVTALILGSTMQSQAQETKRLFKKYRKAKGVMGMSVNGVIVDFAIGVSDMDKETKRALKKMTKGVGFIVMEDSDHRNAKKVMRHFSEYLEDENFESLATVKSNGERVDVKLKKSGDYFRELVVFINADDSAVAVVVNGKFTKDDARKLARAIDTDGKNISFDFKN